jgi:phosphate transport system substrate-binding protein
MYANMKRMNNEMAVSPIVATLVLIVVAVIGAVAVGTIMGTFSTSVSKNVNSNQANAASQNEILVAGSTTVDPITRAAGAVYSAQNPGVKIVSQATGSGAGLQAVGQGVADIGQMSDTPNSYQMTQYPQLQQYQIGMGAIVVITNAANPANATTALSYGDLQAAFLDSTSATLSSGATNYGAVGATSNPLGSAVAYTGALPASETAFAQGDFMAPASVVLRSDSSGTAATFYTFLGNGPTSTSQKTSTSNTTGYLAVNGNPLVVSTVGTTAYSLGFADYGDVVANTQSADSVMIVPYSDAVVSGTTYSGATSGQYKGYYALSYAPTTASNILNDWNQLRNQAHNQYKYYIEIPSLQYEGQMANGMSGTAAYTASNLTMLRNLYYVTNGAPNSDVKNFIEFVQNGPVDPNSATHEGIFQETNNFGMTDIA